MQCCLSIIHRELVEDMFTSDDLLYDRVLEGLDYYHSVLFVDLLCIWMQLKKYYQHRKSHKNVVVHIEGTKVPLYGAGSTLAVSEKGVVVSLSLEFEVRTRGDVVGKLVRTKHRKRVSCPLIMDSSSTKPIIFKKDTCTYSWSKPLQQNMYWWNSVQILIVKARFLFSFPFFFCSLEMWKLPIMKIGIESERCKECEDFGNNYVMCTILPRISVQFILKPRNELKS